MRNRLILSLSSLVVVLVAVGMPLKAQSAEQGKPPQYTYISEWATPRSQWADMVKVDELDRPVMDKLLADGTITGYGAYTNLIHQEGEPTHGSWFTATSEGNLMKALEALYANPGSTTSPVESTSKHWDYIMESHIYSQRSGKFEGGYLSGDTWQVKPGQMHAYTELMKSTLVPMLDKLMADGTITSYGMDVEDYHTGKIGLVTFYTTTTNTEGIDKSNKAFDDLFDKNPSFNAALRSMVDGEGHRDFLSRLRYMSNK